MKKIITVCFVLMWLSHVAFGQPLSGTKTIPGDYPSIEQAIFALNNYGLGSGGVTFNVVAGHSETMTSTYNGRIITTGTEADPIIFQKSGSGNNPIIVASVGSGQYDGIISFRGVSHITFDGIDLRDGLTNTNSTLGMEWGFGLFRNSGTQGSQHITIKNCNITFNGIQISNSAQGYGILSRSTNGEDGNTITVTALSGTNSYNSFYNNSMTDCNGGIYLDGYNAAAPYTFYDQGNSIGGDESGAKSGELGNSITQWKYHGIYASSQNNITVAGNIFSGTCTTALQLTGIWLYNMYNSSFSVHDNTFSADIISTNGSAIRFMYCEATDGVDNTTDFYNNSIVNSTLKFQVVSTNTINGMFVRGGYNTNIYGNTITGNTFGDNVISSQNFLYFMSFLVSQTTPGTANIYNNEITNNFRKVVFPPVDTQAYTFALSISGNKGSITCHDNLIDQNSSLVKTSATLVSLNTTDAVLKFYDNVISGYESRGPIIGINLSGVSDKYIYNNQLSNLITYSAIDYIYGIQSTGSTTKQHIFYNNYIYDLKAPNSNRTAAILGLYAYSGINGFYNNTIYLNATQDVITPDYGTACIYMSDNATNRFDVRNNIVVNTSTHCGLGYTSAMRWAAGAAINSGYYLSTSNNNNFYAGTPAGGNYIFYQSVMVRDSTLESFKSRLWPRESASVSEMPPFENIISAPYDLHLKANVPTQCESGATVVNQPVEIITDNEGQPRFPESGYPDNPVTPATAPDMGADEFGGLKIDITPPTVTFTPLTNTTETTDRLLTTTITDGTGVPTSGSGLPMLYWKKFYSGTWNSVQAVWISPSTYNFTFGDGVAVNDSVYYYIAAQDIVTPVPNIGSSPAYGADGLTADPPACSTPPADSVLLKYKIVAPACGTYQVGIGQTYATLSEAFLDILGRPITCPVTLLLTDATYPTQTFPISIPQFNGISAANTLTIKPANGVAPVFSGSSATGIFNFNGAKYIIIDGSNSESGDKSLSFVNTAVTANSYGVGFVNAGANKSADCVIKNCVIKASSQVTNNTFGIFMSPTVGGYNNIQIDNNTICSARIGISMSGASTDPAINVQITNNIIGSSLDAEAIQFQGIWINYADNTLIRGNEIMGAYAGNTNTSMDGIYLGTGAAATKIRQNKIHDFNAPNGSINTVDAINLASGSATTQTEITNNLIYGIIGKNGCVGINLSSGGNVLIAHNTVSLTSASFYSAASASRYSACLRIASGITLLDVRNNIFQNTQQCIDPDNQSPLTYAIHCASAASAFTSINYNNYFVNAAYPETGLSGRIGYLGSARITLADWQTATGQDANSLNADPVFVSSTDLHTAVPVLNNAGIEIPLVSTDFAGIARTNPPDMGAWEYILPITAINTTDAAAIGESEATLTGTINTAGEVVTTGFEYGTDNSYGTLAAATPSPVRSVTNETFSATIAELSAGTTYHFRAKGVSTTSGETIYGDEMTFTTLGIPVNTTVQNITVTENQETCYNATQTITIAGGGTIFVVEDGGSATMVAGQNILYLPGTTVAAGGYLHGYITLTNEFCPGDAPLVGVKSGLEENNVWQGKQAFRIYPNPTNGSFTVEFSENNEPVDASIEIYGIRGEKVLKTNFSGVTRQTISLEGQPTGLYFIRMVSQGGSVTGKIIKQ